MLCRLSHVPIPWRSQAIYHSISSFFFFVFFFLLSTFFLTLTMYAMIGEFGGIGAFVDGKQWVPNRCAAPLHVDTPTEEAYTYINMVFSSFFILFVLHLLSCQFYLDSWFFYIIIYRPTISTQQTYQWASTLRSLMSSWSAMASLTTIEPVSSLYLSFPFSFPSLSYSSFLTSPLSSLPSFLASLPLPPPPFPPHSAFLWRHQYKFTSSDTQSIAAANQKLIASKK